MISDCDDDYSDDPSYEIDDNSSEHMSDSLSQDLEDEDDIINLNKTVDDQFLNKLCIVNTIDNVEFNVDEDDDNVGDHVIQKGVQYPIHDPNIPWKLMKPKLGERYENPSQLKQCLTNYAVANGYQLQYVKNDSERLLVACGKVETIVLDPLVTPIWIAKHYVRELIERPFIKIKDMQDDILKKFMVKVSKGQCMRAKSRALLEIEGSLIEHYGKLWDYGHEIRRANPGSTVKMDVNLMADGSNEFRRFYVCFKALRDGWISGCRKVIGLDGCFLKGVCKGELISAIGRDGNNQIYPIAWAVVDVENKENWKWFIELLIEDIGVIEGAGLTIMSDQHKGIVEAVKELAPYAEHRQCARHIYVNFHKRFNGVEYRNIFWAAATSTFEADFMSHMEKFRIQNINAYNHLIERDPNTWCRAFFQPGRDCEAVENGICESFNSMLEEIRIFVMERHYRMLSKAQEWESVVCPAIRKKLKKWGQNHRYWYVIPSGGNVFETRNGFEAMVVDLDARKCSCRLWDISGIPCVHSIAAIHFINKDPEDYVSKWFTKDIFKMAYEKTIRPLNGSNMWTPTPYPKPNPPKERIMPGRPSIKRKRSESESESTRVTRSGKTMTCRNCLETGHNARTCKNEKKNPPPKLVKPKDYYALDTTFVYFANSKENDIFVLLL
ncbi:uncharacterized protein LOC112521035 [Cynara cardunculus var. scolymus]|uniref:uncharacterized protein LOC112521035 n=1 Tax=Cynara cardunculus var. scolymus TaxID=59895 RepID=UPI000D62D901|nr:uncharacterized protein LOC112521035 [Cynara cardunculus var. scolymus]